MVVDGVVGLLVLCNADWDFVLGGGGVERRWRKRFRQKEELKIIPCS